MNCTHVNGIRVELTVNSTWRNLNLLHIKPALWLTSIALRHRIHLLYLLRLSISVVFLSASVTGWETDHIKYVIPHPLDYATGCDEWLSELIWRIECLLNRWWRIRLLWFTFVHASRNRRLENECLRFRRLANWLRLGQLLILMFLMELFWFFLLATLWWLRPHQV